LNLQLSAIYQPDSDEVLVEFSSTQDDLTTLSVASQVTAVLNVASTDLTGTVTYRPLATLVVTSEYLLPTQSYAFKFRHPRRRADLFLQLTAIYGMDSYTKSVEVGLAGSPQTEMSLPDNPLFERDPFETPLDQQAYEAPNPNQKILAPEMQNYYQLFDFTLPVNSEEFDPLTYQGGGHRLLMSNQNNSFVFQPEDSAPWVLPAFAFMEPSAQNLIPNPFFNVITGSPPYGQSPTGFTIDPAGALLTQTISANYTTATGAQLWAIRMRQNNSLAAFSQGVVSLSAALPVAGSQAYCFSAYAQIQLMIASTVVTELTFAIQWFDSSMNLLSTSTNPLATSGFSSLTLGSISATSPAGAAFALPQILLSSIDPGDDVILTLFCPQLETGNYPTSRTQGSRTADQIIIPEYNAANQKIRVVFVPGFGVSQVLGAPEPVLLTAGPLVLSLQPDGTFQASLPSYGSVSSAPLSFAAGDTLDFTIQHLSEDSITLYQAGVEIASSSLPVVPPTTDPLNLLGFGGELLRLTVFSRK
jgi:hypothetical protein